MRRLLALAGPVLILAIAAAPAHALEQRLVATDGAENDYLGWDVDVDGDTAVVGGIQQESSSPGIVYVFTRSGDSWAQTARLQATDSQVGDRFGQSVAIDGDTIVVGAPNHIVGDKDAAGAVYTFDRTGAPNRTQTAKLTVAAPAMAGGQLGGAVAIDGDVIAAGARADSTAGGMLSHGAVYTFARTGAAQRNEQARFLASDREEGDQLGESVDVDGDTIVAGAWRKNNKSGPTFLRGTAYTFDATRTGADDETGKLVPTDASGLDQFGMSVAIEGDTIVVGANKDSFPGSSYQGSAYTFARTGSGARGQTAKLIPSDGQAEDSFGYSVDVDGPTIVVGSYLDDSSENLADGSVYTFARSDPDPERNELAKLTAFAPDPYDYFGTSVAIDGDVVIAGASGDDVGENPDQGSATIFFSPATAAACKDGGDNDSDGKTDYPNDPGCTSPDDTSEADPPPATDSPQSPGSPTTTPPGPAGGGGPGGAPPQPGGDGSERPRIVRPRRTFPVDVTQGGRFRLKAKVICAVPPNGEGCRGRTIVIYELERVTASKSRVLGRSSFRVAPGKRAAVTGKLSAAGRKLLKKRGRLKVRIRVTVAGPGTPNARATMKAVLKAPR